MIGGVEEAALIVPQIENECLHAGGLVRGERIVKFLFRSRFPVCPDELLNVDIAGRIL